MLNNSKRSVVVCIIILLCANSWVGAQQFKMGKNLTNLRPSAILELEDANKALILPRVGSPAASIASPYSGMLVYDSLQNEVQYYNGSAWNMITWRDTSIFTKSSVLQSRRTVGINNKALSFYGSADSLVVGSTGYVGIGVGDAPASPLHVRGALRTDSLLLINPKPSTLDNTRDSVLVWNPNTKEVLAVDPDTFITRNIYNTDGTVAANRTVTIGSRVLNINGGDPINNHSFSISAADGLKIWSSRASGTSYLFKWTRTGTTNQYYGYYFITSGSGAREGMFDIVNFRTGATNLTIDSNGYIGWAGITTPRAPLHVAAGPNWNTVFNTSSTNNTAYNIGNSTAWTTITTTSTLATAPVSIAAAGSIVCQNGVIVSNILAYASDARIKNIRGISNKMQDLQTLNQINITDYTYKDYIQYSRVPQKKVVAQDVEKVFPQAVSLSKDFIPNIYAMAEEVRYDGTHATFTMGKEIDLKVGDIVRIYQKDKQQDVPVASVSGNTFMVKDVDTTILKEGEGDVFVYGKQVNDFKTVDYNALSMLNISATQALASQLDETMQAVNAEKDKVKKLKSRMAKLRALIQKL